MKVTKTKTILSLLALLVSVIAAHGLTNASLEEYDAVATGRAGKLVAGMQLEDPATEAALVELIANQYKGLFTLHELRDGMLAELKSVDHGFAKYSEQTRAAIEASTERAIERLHREFVAKITAVAGPEGAEAVKNGMTYSVAPNTYGVYMQMVPDLPEADRMKIKAWLYEAREYAMDAGSSDDKHKVFGKYKGRINNYLSQQGIDLKQAERDMWDRLKAEKAKKEQANK